MASSTNPLSPKADTALSVTSTHVPRLWVNEQLQQLPGVGRKVADCVAVFSMDRTDTIPVDVVSIIHRKDTSTYFKKEAFLYVIGTCD